MSVEAAEMILVVMSSSIVFICRNGNIGGAILRDAFS